MKNYLIELLKTLVKGIVIAVILSIGLHYLYYQPLIDKMENNHKEELKILVEQKDMYKKRWQIRDDAAKVFYDRYLDAKERYEDLKKTIGIYENN